ncbi:MAG: hypothetical protein MN733_20805, partial [Nitrososphaera sp.]|nr:hypothetical protein [Nitrososphaera sp.]
ILVIQKSMNLTGGTPPEVMSLAYAYAMSGKKDEAQKMLNELKERAKQEYVSPMLFSYIYLSLGEKDQVFEWLQKAYEVRDSWVIWLKVSEPFDSLRSDPRFKELMRKIGLEK